MRASLFALILVALVGCGKSESASKPPAIERVTDGRQTCWRVVSDGGWHATDWKCETVN